MKWNFIRPGEIIDVVAPGYPSQSHEVQGAADFLKSWGLQPRIPQGLMRPHFLHANEDVQRFSFLRNALESEDSQVIWCLRGGYGSNRLLPYLAKMKKPKKSKLLIGISDITSLHSFMAQEWGWSTLHGPLLDRLGRNLVAPRYEKELKSLLFGGTTEIEFNSLKALNQAAKNVSTVKSKIVGGNLTVLQSSLGTPWQMNADRSLLFLEDIGERGYRIDRMLEQFRQAGIFKKCHGIILGDFVGGEEPVTKKNNFSLVFKRWARDLEIPIFQGMRAGHGVIQRPVPLNTSCVLSLENGKGQLCIQSGGKK